MMTEASKKALVEFLLDYTLFREEAERIADRLDSAHDIRLAGKKDYICRAAANDAAKILFPGGIDEPGFKEAFASFVNFFRKLAKLEQEMGGTENGGN